MQDPVTKRWHCADGCGAPYQQKEHLEKHQANCRQYKGFLAEKAKAAPPPPPPVPDEPPYQAPDAERRAQAKAKKAKE